MQSRSDNKINVLVITNWYQRLYAHLGGVYSLIPWQIAHSGARLVVVQRCILFELLRILDWQLDPVLVKGGDNRYPNCVCTTTTTVCMRTTRLHELNLLLPVTLPLPPLFLAIQENFSFFCGWKIPGNPLFSANFSCENQNVQWDFEYVSTLKRTKSLREHA